MQLIKRDERRRGRPKKTFDEELFMYEQELLDRQKSRLYNELLVKLEPLCDDMKYLRDSHNKFIKFVTACYILMLVGFGSMYIMYIK